MRLSKLLLCRITAAILGLFLKTELTSGVLLPRGVVKPDSCQGGHGTAGGSRGASSSGDGGREWGFSTGIPITFNPAEEFFECKVKRRHQFEYVVVLESHVAELPPFLMPRLEWIRDNVTRGAKGYVSGSFAKCTPEKLVSEMMFHADLRSLQGCNDQTGEFEPEELREWNMKTRLKHNWNWTMIEKIFRMAVNWKVADARKTPRLTSEATREFLEENEEKCPKNASYWVHFLEPLNLFQADRITLCIELKEREEKLRDNEATN